MVHVWTFTGNALLLVFLVAFVFYASLENIWEAYWFQLVHASVRARVRPFVQAMVLKLNVWIPHLK